MKKTAEEILEENKVYFTSDEKHFKTKVLLSMEQFVSQSLPSKERIMELFYKLGRYVNTKYTDIDAIVAEWISKQELSAPDKQEEEKEMKIVYIAHPISGDVKGNLEKIRRIIRGLNLMFTNIVPFAHYFVDCYALDDTVPEERDRGIKNDIALFKAGFIDEVWLFGDRISNGMKAEIELAKNLNIPIISKSDDFDFPTDDKPESHSDQMIDRINEERGCHNCFDCKFLTPVFNPNCKKCDENFVLWQKIDSHSHPDQADKAIIEDVEARDECANNIWDGYTNEEKHIYTLGFNHCFEWYRDRLSSLQSKPKVSDEPEIRIGQIFSVEGRKYIIGLPKTTLQDTNEHGQIVLTLVEI
jgi:hypothetical protein